MLYIFLGHSYMDISTREKCITIIVKINIKQCLIFLLGKSEMQFKK